MSISMNMVTSEPEEEKRRTNGHGDGAIDMRPASPAAPQPLTPETSSPFSIPAPTPTSPDAAASSAAPASTTLPVGRTRKDSVADEKPEDTLGAEDKDTLSGQVQNTVTEEPNPTTTAITGHLSNSPPSAIEASTIALASSVETKMLFTDRGKNGTAAHRRRVMATTSAFTEYEADLTNRDRTKAKEAVKKYLSERVQTTWEYEWPRSTSQSISQTSPQTSLQTQPSNTQSSTNGDDDQWKERDEWESNDSVGEEEDEVSTPAPATPSAQHPAQASQSPFRFDSPDGVGEAVRKSKAERRRRRRKRLGDEMAWNDGVRCFVHRRNAWTGARRTPAQKSVLHPHYEPPVRTPKIGGNTNGDIGGENTEEEDDEDDESYECDQIPIAPPLLPKENPIRAGIGPAAYGSIYDKVVCQSQTPSVPINLSDVVRSCVAGWQRDGEWPPRDRPIEPMMARKKSGGIRKSLQRVFGVGRREAEI